MQMAEEVPECRPGPGGFRMADEVRRVPMQIANKV